MWAGLQRTGPGAVELLFTQLIYGLPPAPMYRGTSARGNAYVVWSLKLNVTPRALLHACRTYATSTFRHLRGEAARRKDPGENQVGLSGWSQCGRRAFVRNSRHMIIDGRKLRKVPV